MMMPYKGAANGGANTFLYYISGIASDPRFHVTLIAKAQTEKEKDAAIENVNIIPVQNSPISLRDPLQSLKDVASKFYPFTREGNTLRNSVYVNIKKEIDRLSFIPDVIVLEFSQMLCLVDYIKRKFPKAKIWSSEHDVSFLWYQRKAASSKSYKQSYWGNLYQYRKKWELNFLGKCDLIMPHNDKDAKLLIDSGIPSYKVKPIVPYYQHNIIDRKPDYKTIIFYGAMNRPENYQSAIWFIENVLPLLNGEDITFTIIGGHPDESLRKFESERVQITGFVDDLNEYFSTCMCLVAPLLLGAGIKIKILEAMYAGIPTLTNDIGIEGIPAKDKEDYFFCDSPEQYASVIKDIVSHKVDLDIISENSKECIGDSFDMEQSLENYKNRLVGLEN